MHNERYDRLLSLPEWLAYSRDPKPITFRELVTAARACSIHESIPFALALLFSMNSNWRVAQHLANLLIDAGDSALALHYASKAVELSVGNPEARLTLALSYWLQRFTQALFYELAILRKALKRYGTPSRRRYLQQWVVDLYVNGYCYIGRLDLARPWIRSLFKLSAIRGETLLAVFTTAFNSYDDVLAWKSANMLASQTDMLGGRERSRITLEVRRQFLQTLRARG